MGQTKSTPGEFLEPRNKLRAANMFTCAMSMAEIVCLNVTQVLIFTTVQGYPKHIFAIVTKKNETIF